MRARLRSRSSVFFTSSLTRLDLPLPDTPVTHTNMPSGMVTSMFFRLFARAPRTTSALPLPGRREAGTSMRLRPERYCPVMESGAAAICSGVPSATT